MIINSLFSRSESRVTLSGFNFKTIRSSRLWVESIGFVLTFFQRLYTHQTSWINKNYSLNKRSIISMKTKNKTNCNLVVIIYMCSIAATNDYVHYPVTNLLIISPVNHLACYKPSRWEAGAGECLSFLFENLQRDESE